MEAGRLLRGASEGHCWAGRWCVLADLGKRSGRRALRSRVVGMRDRRAPAAAVDAGRRGR